MLGKSILGKLYTVIKLSKSGVKVSCNCVKFIDVMLSSSITNTYSSWASSFYLCVIPVYFVCLSLTNVCLVLSFSVLCCPFLYLSFFAHLLAFCMPINVCVQVVCQVEILVMCLIISTTLFNGLSSSFLSVCLSRIVTSSCLYPFSTSYFFLVHFKPACEIVILHLSGTTKNTTGQPKIKMQTTINLANTYLYGVQTTKSCDGQREIATWLFMGQLFIFLNSHTVSNQSLLDVLLLLRWNQH